MKVIVRKPNDKQKKIMESCQIWEHEKGSFPWEYKDQQETCLIISGKAYVEMKRRKNFFRSRRSCNFPNKMEMYVVYHRRH